MKIKKNGKVTFDPKCSDSVGELMNYLVANDLLKGADLRGANLSDSSLAGADFTWSNLGGSTFTSANLDGSCFENAFMSWVNFTGAESIEYAKITRSQLEQLEIVEDESDEN